jgi:hypothetical protein
MGLVYPKRRNLLMSYPRSGNTFLRYCIEQCTGKKTVSFVRPEIAEKGGLDTLIKMGMSKMDAEPVSDTFKEEIVLEKTHEVFPGDEQVFNKETGGRMVLLIRDFTESIGRHIVSHIETKYKTEIPKYKQLLDAYDSYEGDKMVIHYEDLVTDTPATIKRLLEFLGEFEQYKFDDFIDNLDEHKKKSIDKYGKYHTSFTRGTDLKFHHKNFPEEILQEINSYLSHPLTQRYIQETETLT